MVALRIQPRGSIQVVRADFFQLTAGCIVRPNGESGIVVHMPLEVPEMVFFPVPSAMHHRVTEDREVRGRFDGFADGEDERMYGEFLVVASPLSNVPFFASGIPF